MLPLTVVFRPVLQVTPWESLKAAYALAAQHESTWLYVGGVGEFDQRFESHR
jgi:hypothetical protein